MDCIQPKLVKAVRFSLLALLPYFSSLAAVAQSGDIVIQVNPLSATASQSPSFYSREVVFEPESAQPKTNAAPTSPLIHSTPVAPQITARSSSTWRSFAAVNNPTRTQSLTLWATHYYVYRAQTVSKGQPLLDPAGNRLGPTLSKRDWCYAALQGTVRVDDTSTTYNFAGRGSDPQVNCATFFSSLSDTTLDKVNRVRFKAARAMYGYGTDGLSLVPYRTIAVDRSRIPIGSVVYIPDAKGQPITLPSGERAIHDGFFYAADVGSAIKGNHIDVFTGTSEQRSFSFITSKPNQTFQAFLVQNAEIAQALRSLHRGQ